MFISANVVCLDRLEDSPMEGDRLDHQAGLSGTLIDGFTYFNISNILKEIFVAATLFHESIW